VSPDQVLILVAIVTAAMTGVRILRPSAAGLGRSIGAPSGRDAVTAGEVSELHRRVAELEERVDFAERLLAQREPGSLGQGRAP
jgi:hypothetical protein